MKRNLYVDDYGDSVLKEERSGVFMFDMRFGAFVIIFIANISNRIPTPAPIIPVGSMNLLSRTIYLPM